MANYENKTIGDIFKILNAKYTALRAKFKDTTPLLEKATVKSIFYAFSASLGIVWQQSVWIYKQCFPQTCGLPALKFWGNLIGVDYKDGVSANLSIQLDDVTAGALSSGTIYKDLESGLIYKTVSQVPAENGKIITTVQCTTPGTVGNIPVGTVLNIANPLDGIPSTATVIDITITGTEDEEVEDYRKRVLFRFRNKAQGGSAVDYFIWATEVSGIVDAFPYVLTEGIISLYLVASGSGLNRTPSGSVSPNPFAKWVDGQFVALTGSGQMLAVANSIEGSAPGVHDRRPMNVRVNLLAPNYTPFKVEITGLTDTSYNESIKNALISYFDSKKPNLIVLDYGEADAKINKQQISSAVTDVIETETFTTITLKDASDNSIDETTLGIGCLSYLSSLKINGTNVPVDE